MKDREKFKAWRKKRFREQYLPAYLAFMLFYPFGLEDLDGEIWRWIAGYEGLYQISNFGRVKSFPRNSRVKLRILKPTLSQHGYLKISLTTSGKYKNCSIHVLVAETFILNPENKTIVNHIDGNKFNNYFKNLEWSTPCENTQHAVKTGLIKSGTKNYNSKLTENQVRYIREVCKLNDPEYSAGALARKFNVGRTAILNVFYGRTYKNID